MKDPIDKDRETTRRLRAMRRLKEEICEATDQGVVSLAFVIQAIAEREKHILRAIREVN